MTICIRQVPAATVYPLRHAILRPNHAYSQCEFPGDDHAETVHFAALSNDSVIGIASVYRQPPPSGDAPDAWRVRGMATEPARRGEGVGGQLLRACIAHVESRGGVLMWCNARTPAVTLYERVGFLCVGNEFELPGIGPHYLMMKRIKGASDG